jgi:nucleoside-diphosphate-sugar epimerase
VRIAILGATSQIAQDLIEAFSDEESKSLSLFARRPIAVEKWLESKGLSGRFSVDDFSSFAQQTFDVVINFIGVGDPAEAIAMGNSIFDLTLRFDEIVLDYLKVHPNCRYLFLSSGAAYGSSFKEPVTRETPAIVSLNNLAESEWYGVAKLYAECRHRAHSELSIIDVRVFNYFSHTQNISARFLITEIARAIRDGTVLKTSADFIMRDYLHPSDFYQLLSVLVAAPTGTNAVVDCYSLAPIEKKELLETMQEKFDLRYEVVQNVGNITATGSKPHYYSLNTIASDFGYKPRLNSLDGILLEVSKMLLV